MSAVQRVIHAQYKFNGEARAELAAKVYDLRLAGHSYRRCAEIVGVSASQCHRLSLEHIAITQKDDRDAIRQMEMDRLDGLMNVALAQFAKHPDRPDWKAFEAVMRVMDRRAKLLGIDAPVRVEATVQGDPAAEDLAAVLERVRQAEAAARAAREA